MAKNSDSNSIKNLWILLYSNLPLDKNGFFLAV